jgi:NAD-specific glutamate dehydrogenase
MQARKILNELKVTVEKFSANSNEAILESMVRDVNQIIQRHSPAQLEKSYESSIVETSSEKSKNKNVARNLEKSDLEPRSDLDESIRGELGNDGNPRNK